MVKHLSIDMDNDLYEKVIIVKGKRTWIEFFLNIVEEVEQK